MSELNDHLDKFIDSFTKYLIERIGDESPGASRKVLKSVLDNGLAGYLESNEGYKLTDLNNDIESTEEYIEELQETEGKYYDQSDFLHELASDVTELVNYGNAEQKARYLESLDDCEALKEYGNSTSALNTTANLSLVI